MSPTNIEIAPDSVESELLRRQVEMFESALQLQADSPEHNDNELNAAYSRLNSQYGAVPGLLLMFDEQFKIRHANELAGKMLGIQTRALPGRKLQEWLPSADDLLRRLKDTPEHLVRVEGEMRQYDGEPLPVLMSLAEEVFGQDHFFVLIALDLREHRQREIQVRQSQKLEAMGSLAAGIAHEINTPLQYMGDNLGFIGEAAQQLVQLIAAAESWSRMPDARNADALRSALQQCDPSFMMEALVPAVNQANEGLRRVSEIVNSMRSFTHASKDPVPENINELVEQALTMARHAYKYVAVVERELAPLPSILCRRDHIVQVLINLIVNAAHSIETYLTRTQEMQGLIKISTNVVDNHWVQIELVDSGTGIQAEVLHRIYDPFFTTKDVGKGTGQGLSISRSIVVEQHHGHLVHESIDPHGCRVTIRLPI